MAGSGQLLSVLLLSCLALATGVDQAPTGLASSSDDGSPGSVRPADAVRVC